ncbi:galactokinase [Demequina sp.]|uniref:galactokinase n=1 Tax=Demequina sp. TaxID=2050685 RepID=UPI003A860D65
MGSEPDRTHPEWLDAWTRGQGEMRARALFKATWEGDPEGAWSAPGRVTVIGEHTDYNGGLTLPTVTAHRTYVAARVRDDDLLRVVSEGAQAFAGPGDRWQARLSEISPDTARGWPAYVASVVWALMERGYEGPGLDLAVASCIPADAGLASSGALECATALAVNALWRLALDSDESHAELAEACVHGEEAIALSPTGGLDQHTQLRCREGEALEMDFASRPPASRHCPLYFPDYGLGLLVVDVRSSARQRTPGFRERQRQCEAAAHALGVAKLGHLAGTPDALERVAALPDPLLRSRARHVVTESERVADVAALLADTGPAQERFVEIGRQLFRSHASLEVDYGVSSPELNLAVDAAYRAGVLGARLVGAGFGGSVIALVRRSAADEVALRIDQAFIDAGAPRPRFLMV